MAKFRKKPIVIEAVQFKGNNLDEILDFAGDPMQKRISEGIAPETLMIRTLEGIMTADKDTWILRGVQGEYYPCDPEIFEQTYERVDE